MPFIICASSTFINKLSMISRSESLDIPLLLSHFIDFVVCQIWLLYFSIQVIVTCESTQTDYLLTSMTFMRLRYLLVSYKESKKQ